MQTTTVNSVEVLDRVYVLMCSVRLVTGTARPPREAIGSTAPQELLTSGAMKLHDPEYLKPLKTFKGRVDDLCSQVGTRGFGGWVLPAEVLPGLFRKLNDLRKEFEVLKAAYLRDLAQAYKEQCEQHPGYAEILRALQIDRPTSKVASAIDFAICPVKIGAAQDVNLQGDTVAQANRISADFWDDIALIAQDNLAGFASAKKTRRILSPLQDIVVKLGALAYLAPQASIVQAGVQRVIEQAGAVTPIEGAALQALATTFKWLAEPQKMQALRREDFDAILAPIAVPGSTQAAQPVHSGVTPSNEPLMGVSPSAFAVPGAPVGGASTTTVSSWLAGLHATEPAPDVPSVATPSAALAASIVVSPEHGAVPPAPRPTAPRVRADF